MSTDKGNHYKGVKIDDSMIGQPLDPAVIEKYYPMDSMQCQAFKKVWFAGKRGKKDKLQDLKDAIGALERQIELDSIAELQYNPKDVAFPNIYDTPKSKPNKSLSIEKEVISGECIGCMFDDICDYDQHEHICNPFVQDEIFGLNCTEHRVIFKLKEVKQ